MRFRARWLVYLLVLVLLAAFPFGPLFPWSPWKPGYARLALKRSDIYYPDRSTPDPVYRQMDDLIAESESFHQLPVSKKIIVVECRSWDDFERFMPQHRNRVVGAVTARTGTVIYLTPKLREKQLDVVEFLRHELSHATLHQNQSLLNAFRIGDEPWFSEGIAVLFGRQRAYGTAAEFSGVAGQRDLRPLFDGSPQTDIRLAYQAWRYFLNYQMEIYAGTKFFALEKGCIEEPADCRQLFQDIYGMPLSEAVAEFQQALRNGRGLVAD